MHACRVFAVGSAFAVALSLTVPAPGAHAATVAAAADPIPAPPTAPPAPPALSKLDEAAEVVRLEEALAREVPHHVIRTAETDASWLAMARAEVAAAGFVIDHPQLLVVVDRNPRVQQLAVLVASPQTEWQVLGGTKVSTGSTGRFDHYITPRGVFHVTTAILGFRAEGTLNENGIRGLGAKGMRVWDFGWQVAAKGWNAGPGKPDRIPIRLMMHATDPDRLEQRIGQPASQGCVRIPSAMNRFLDNHGVLDAEYERAAATEIRFRALLPVGRHPSGLAGNTLVVVDSADKTAMKVASRTAPMVSTQQPTVQ
jgi:hypothetical protein